MSKKLVSRLKNLINNPLFYYFVLFNRIKFRCKGVRYGNRMKIFESIYLQKHKDSIIEIGDDFVFSSGKSYNPLCRNIKGSIYAPKGSKIIIGDGVGISSACIWAKKSITIGDNVKIGGDCILLDTDAHSLDYRIRVSKDVNEDGVSLDSLNAKYAPIIIENDVLIGTRCIILKGVTIGARSIIGSGSVVTKSIPPDSIAAGNPCKVIKYL